MKFIKVHFASNKPMHVNVATISTVQDFNGHAHIVTLAPNGDNSWRFNVQESADQVLALIEEATRS